MTRTGRTRMPIGFLGMMVLVALVEFGISQSPQRFADTASYNWRLAVDDVAREGPTTQVACLGDSLTKIGVIPEMIRAGTGLRSYNFGMARAPAQATYFVFRRLIEAGGRPSALVVDFKPSILAGRPRLGLRHFAEIVNLREAWELAREDGHVEFFVPFAVTRFFPTIRYRQEIRESIVATLAGQVAPTWSTNRLALRNWSVNLGNHLNASSVPFSGEVPRELIDNVGQTRWRCHPINDRAIHRIFDLAASQAIPVYWILPPLSPPLQQRRDELGVDADYTRYIQATIAGHPGVHVIDARRSGYDLTEFADATHLNGRGSVTFSHDLAEILARPEAQPRWVALGRFQARLNDLGCEDIDQSRVVLESAPTRR